MLRPETMWKAMICVPTDCKGQGSYLCSGVDDCRLSAGIEGHRRPLQWPLPRPTPQSNSIDRKPSKRILTDCDKDAEV